MFNFLNFFLNFFLVVCKKLRTDTRAQIDKRTDGMPEWVQTPPLLGECKM